MPPLHKMGGLEGIEVEELLDVIDELLTLNRVGTFDEEPDERRICDYARAVVGRYRAAASTTSFTTLITPE